MSINIKLKALRTLHKLSKQKVMVIEDWGPIDLSTGVVSLSRGSEEELPNWLVNELEKKGVVKKLETLTIEELGRILFQEKQNINIPASLYKLPKDFYHKLGEKIKELQYKRESSIELIDLIRKLKAISNEIITIRIRKCILLAFLDIQDQSILSNMTEEEILIYQTIKDIIKEISGEIFGISTDRT
jgi:DNA replication factor GINS